MTRKFEVYHNNGFIGSYSTIEGARERVNRERHMLPKWYTWITFRRPTTLDEWVSQQQFTIVDRKTGRVKFS